MAGANLHGRASLLLLVCISAAAAQSPVIKVEVPSVVVDVIVSDRKGHHIPGLTADDFKIYEDDAPQAIVSFTPPQSLTEGAHAEANRPASTSTAEAVPPNPPATAPVSRLVTLVMDFGDLQQAHIKRACTEAAKYVEKTIAAGTSVALYWVDSSLHLAVPFTLDKKRALDALSQLSGHVSTGRFTALDRIRAQRQIDDLFTTLYPETLTGAAPSPRTFDPLLKPLEREMYMLRSWLIISSTFQARAIFVALRAIAVGYRDIPGRKSVVVFSEGFLHSPDAGPELQAVIDAANRANVSFYVIDPSGANSGMSADTHAPDIGGRRASAPDAIFTGAEAQALGRNQFDWEQTLASDVHDDLGVVATSTGGFLVSDTNDLLLALERVERDASEFYTLLYHPTNRNYNGAFRRIKVELAQGYRLRYRRGYWGIPPGREVMMTPAAAQLLAALETGTRKSSFSPNVNAALLKAPDGRFSVPVAVSLPGALVHFEKQKDRFLAGVTMLVVARDAQGQLVAIHERYGDLRLTKKELEDFKNRIFNLQGHIPIPELQPVTVQAIVQFANGAAGESVRAAVNAGTTGSGPRLTSLVLTNRVEPAECGADPADPLCVKNLRLYLPSQARFTSSDRLTVYFMALDLATDAQTKQPGISVNFDLGTGGNTAPLIPDGIQAVNGISPDSMLVLAVFDLKNFKPGNYTLLVDAEDTVQRSRVSGRAEFTVE